MKHLVFDLLIVAAFAAGYGIGHALARPRHHWWD